MSRRTVGIGITAGMLALALAAGGFAQRAGEKGKDRQMKQDWSDTVDAEKAKKATAVLRVRYKAFKGGDKYRWETVEVLGVIENRSRYKFPGEMDVAHRDTAEGVAKGESTIYVEPYNNVDESLWKLVD
jgi:hypothetical protein